MKRQSLWFSCALMLAACGSEKKQAGDTTAGPPAKETVDKKAAVDEEPSTGEAKSGQPVATEEAPPAQGARTLEPIPPAEFDLRPMMEYRFLGWTEDARMFVLQAAFDASSEPLGMEPNVSFRLVHDAYTGDIVDVYRHDNKMKFNPEYFESEKEWKQAFAKQRGAWKRAKSHAEWKQWLAANPLVAREPTLKSPDGEWTFEVEFLNKKPKDPVNWKLRAKRDRGFYFDWEIHDLMTIDMAGGDISRHLDDEPRFHVFAVQGDHRILSLDVTVAISEEDRDPPEKPQIVKGNVRPFWSPRGDRVFWAVYYRAQKSTPAGDTRPHAEFALAAAGPELRVVDAGAGTERALAAVAQLEGAGLAVSGVTRGKADGKPSRVAYGGDAGKPLAEQIAKLLAGGLTVEAAGQAPGSVRVLLGK